MSMRLLPKEPVMLRDTAGQDRVIDPASSWKRHRTLIIVILAAVLGLSVLLMYILRYAGAGVSVDRSRLSIAAVERGSFVRDIASEGQVLAVIDSPDLTAKLSQEEASSVGLRIDWQRATLDADQKLLQLRDAFNQ